MLLLAFLVGCDGGDEVAARKTPHIYSCRHCGSTQVRQEAGPPFPTEISPDTADYHSPSYDGCAHEWCDMVGRAEPQRLKSGRVVLIRKGDTYAAVMLTAQEHESWDVVVKHPAVPAEHSYGRTSPARKARDESTGAYVDKVTYRWVYRSDGSAKLDPSDAAVQWGLSVSTGAYDEGIRVKDVRVDWSAVEDGMGCLYYRKYPGEPVFRSDTQFCITDLDTFAGLDGSDACWRYKGAISDTTP